MVLVLRKVVLLNQVCKNAVRQSSRFMCKANPADNPDHNPEEHHHWAKPPSKETHTNISSKNFLPAFSILFDIYRNTKVDAK